MSLARPTATIGAVARHALALLLATGLASCGRGDADPPAASSATAVAPVELRPATDVASAPRGRSPFGTAPSPFMKPPELPLPPPPPTRPGGLSYGEAQAVVFSALPDTAVYKDMTPTPQGYRLRVHTGDAKDVEQLAQRLSKDGHFELRPTGAAESAAAGVEVTLDLAEHGLVR